MNTKKVLNQSFDFFSELFAQLFSGSSLRYVKYVGCGIGIALLAAFLYFAQQIRVSWREQKAQYAYSQVQDLFEQQRDAENPSYQGLVEKIDAAYYQNSGSNLVPYFLNLKSEVLLEQDNKDEALQVLESIVSVVDHGMPGELVRTKYALILLDTDRKQEGIEKLTTLAQSQHNQVRDIAQFYLGRYYWVHNDIEMAKHIWNDLINEQRVHRISPSPWAKLAEESLASMS